MNILQTIGSLDANLGAKPAPKTLELPGGRSIRLNRAKLSNGGKLARLWVAVKNGSPAQITSRARGRATQVLKGKFKVGDFQKVEPILVPSPIGPVPAVKNGWVPVNVTVEVQRKASPKSNKRTKTRRPQRPLPHEVVDAAAEVLDAAAEVLEESGEAPKAASDDEYVDLDAEVEEETIEGAVFPNDSLGYEDDDVFQQVMGLDWREAIGAWVSPDYLQVVTRYHHEVAPTSIGAWGAPSGNLSTGGVSPEAAFNRSMALLERARTGAAARGEVARAKVFQAGVEKLNAARDSNAIRHEAASRFHSMEMLARGSALSTLYFGVLEDTYRLAADAEGPPVNMSDLQRLLMLEETAESAKDQKRDADRTRGDNASMYWLGGTLAAAIFGALIYANDID